MDLRSRYHGSALGLGWTLLNPILMTVVLSTVFCQLFNQDFRSFAPFLLSGLAFWNFLIAITSEGCIAFQRGEAYIRQHPAPLAIYPLRATLGAMIHLSITLLVVVTLVWGVQGLGNLPALASLPATLVILMVFGWSLAICLGIANVLVTDMQYLVPVGMQVLFYLTPIMYPPELLRQKGLRFVELNPLASFLELVRADPGRSLSFAASIRSCLGHRAGNRRSGRAGVDGHATAAGVLPMTVCELSSF